MKPKTLMLLAVAGGCGLIAMFGVQSAMQGGKGPAKIQTAKVLVALAAVDSGVRLTPDNVGFQQRPVAGLPDDIVTSEEEYHDRAARIPLQVGDIIRKSKLTAKGGYGKSIEITPGMRVITISVDSTHTASGLIRPGDKVDVLVTYRGRSDRGVTISKTKTLLEYIEVFATDNQTASKIEDETGKKGAAPQTKYVSLLLTPEQVTYVKLAESKGTLSLSWRHRLDDELVQTKVVDDKLLEELEGTVGVNEDRPLYDQHYSSAFVDDESPADAARRQSLTVADGTKEPQNQSTSQFLNTVQKNKAATGPDVQPALVAMPPKNSWTIQVYNGNAPTDHYVPLPEPKPEPTAAPSGSLTDLIKSVWGKPSTTPAQQP